MTMPKTDPAEEMSQLRKAKGALEDARSHLVEADRCGSGALKETHKYAARERLKAAANHFLAYIDQRIF